MEMKPPTSAIMTESASATGQKIPPATWYALAIVTLIYACHFLDRMMIAIIIEPARHEFHLTDSQIGVLTGLAYGATFALAGIPLGLLIDRVNRVKLLAVLVTIWSGMTTLSGFAQSYTQLLLARMGVGASEAGGSPTSLSMISDLFPPEKRSTAVGFFFLSNAIGAVLSIVIGGFVAAHYGWRAAMLIAGIPGLLLGVTLLLTVREPKRGAMENAGAPPATRVAASLPQVFSYIVRNKSMLHLLAGVSLTTAGVATIGSWLPAFMMRFHGFDIKQAGFAVAMASGFCGAIGSVLGGMMSDRFAKTNPRRRMDISMGVCLVAALTGALAALVGSGVGAVAMMSLTQMIAFVVFPAAFAAMLGITSANMRGTVSASMQVCTNLLGYGIGPFMVGVFSDFYGGDQSLRYAMITVMCICFPWGAVHFWLAARAWKDLTN
ncbi:spinster family MFS transporter [Herbaspirillum autotrophicum]|uniref:spinster family MFS transporter n=1 Tax=Herbaspirillum autotrophicum TaxID=180195 RepID=UPI000A95D9A1|nr:MFS transporter [Herbaspirillum autotrophicum]